MKRFFPILLIISTLINMFTLGIYRRSMKYDKYQAIFSILTYMDHLKSFNEYIDIYLEEPDNADILNILFDQENEMVKIVTNTNYYALKKMKPLYTSLISINVQANSLVLKCKEGLDSREDIGYINNNLKEIISYLDEIQSDMLSDKIESDYLVKNQLLVSSNINEILERNKHFID